MRAASPSSIGAGMRRPLGADPLRSLSSRELQVLRAIARGKKPSEIARNSSLSPHTVQTYRRRILSKLHMKSNAQLVRFALERGLVN